MLDMGINNRNQILSRALLLESITSTLIGGLIGIKNTKSSKILGYQSTSISLNNKIDLLIDLEVLNSTQKKKVQAFMEIRNQFMHNLQASTFEKCITYTGKNESWYFKLYPPPKNLTKENQLKYSILRLSDEVLDLTSEILDHLKQKIYNEAYSDTVKKSNEAFRESIAEAKNILDEHIKKLLANGAVISARQLKNLGSFINELIYELWKKKFKRVDKN